jgi:hypothetical protein
LLQNRIFLLALPAGHVKGCLYQFGAMNPSTANYLINRFTVNAGSAKTAQDLRKRLAVMGIRHKDRARQSRDRVENAVDGSLATLI